MNENKDLNVLTSKVDEINEEFGIDDSMPENIEYDHSGEEVNENGLMKKESLVYTDGSGAAFPVMGDTDDDAYNIITDQDKKISAEFQSIIDNTEVTKEDIVESLRSTFEFASEEDLDKLYVVVKRIDSGEDFSIFNALPESVKEFISKMMGDVGDDRAKRMFAKEFFVNITDEIRNFKAYSSLNKYKEDKTSEIIKEEMQNVYKDFFTDQKKRFEDDYKARYEVLIKEDSDESKEKAQLCLDIANAYKESYTLEAFKEDVTNHRGKYKVKKIQLEKPERELESFNRKYEKSRFDMTDIALIKPILFRYINEQFPDKEYTEDDVFKFILAFVKYTMNYSPENLAQHTFMFYFVHNILVFDNITSENDKVFISDIISNIAYIIDILKEMY